VGARENTLQKNKKKWKYLLKDEGKVLTVAIRNSLELNLTL